MQNGWSKQTELIEGETVLQKSIKLELALKRDWLAKEVNMS